MVAESSNGGGRNAMSTFAVAVINGQKVRPIMLLDDRAEAEAIAAELLRRRHRIEVRTVHDATVPPSSLRTA
jgi:hypothetical protein